MKSILLSENEILALRIALSDGDACTICSNRIDENEDTDDSESYFNDCGKCWYEEIIKHLQKKLSKL